MRERQGERDLGRPLADGCCQRMLLCVHSTLTSEDLSQIAAYSLVKHVDSVVQRDKVTPAGIFFPQRAP